MSLLHPIRAARYAAFLAVCTSVVLLATDFVSTQSPRRGGRRPNVEMVDGREAVAGEVIVRFRDGAARAEQEAAADQRAEADEVERVGRRGLRRMHSRRMSARQLVDLLRQDPDVELVEPNYMLHVDRQPNDTYFPLLWGLFNNGQVIGGSSGIPAADTSATLAWDITTGNRSVVVGVIDTGIDYTHPDLLANVWSAPAPFTVTIGATVITCAAGTHGFNAITNTCDPRDDHYHGTHVSGTIGASGNNGIGVAGVNWATSIMGLKFLSSSGSGSTSDAIKAIDFAIQAKAAFASSGAANVRVLSNSWGGDGYSLALKEAIDRSNAANMLFVAAAGNSSRNIDSVPTYPASYPSSNIVTVAATDNREGLASFSNWGATSVHLGAPGVNVLSTTPNNSYGYLSGTSMATPHVSGAAALVASYCQMTAAELKQALINGVDPIASLVGKTTTGGRLNIYRTLAACRRVNNGTLVPSVTSPQAVGTPVTWTVNASGGVTPYAYKWMVYNGVSWTMQPWSSSNVFTWTPPSVGTYYVGVWVKSAGNSADAAEFPISVRFDVIASATVTSAAIATDKPAPQPIGTPIVLTAVNPTGGIAPLQYKWSLFDGNTWTTLSGWSTSNAFTWTPSAANANYVVRVWVRSAGATLDAPETTATIPYNVLTSTRVTQVTVTPSVASPQPYGTPVTFTASAIGGIGPLQYKWMVYNGAWTMQAWSTSNTFAWTPSAAGTYSIGVWVKSAGNSADAAEVPQAVQYVVSTPPRVTSAAISADKTSPQVIGTPIIFTALPTGGRAPFQYRWRVLDGATARTVLDWNASDTLTWNPSSPSAQYQVVVDVRGSWNTSDVEATASAAWTITAPPMTGVTVAAGASPMYALKTNTFTAAVTGGTAPYQYKWLVYNGATWSTASEWQSSNQLVYRFPSASSAYIVRAWARSAGNTTDAAEALGSLPVTVNAAVPLSVAISGTSSPQPVGTALTYTGTATGGADTYSYAWTVTGASYSYASGWSAQNTVLRWSPPAAGTFTINLSVKNITTIADVADATASTTLVATSATVTAVTLTPDRSSPQPYGTPITWTAAPSGGIGPHQFKWMVWDGVRWTMQAWSSSSSFTWTPATAGSYYIGVWVKSAGNPADAAEFAHAVAYTVTTPAVASAVTLAADRTAPQLAGTTITWTAAATGGTAPLMYQWQVFDGASWSIAANWNTSNSWVWQPATGNIAYAVRVSVRGSWNTITEASATAAFAITAPPISSVSVTGPASTYLNAPAQFTAQASGGAVPYQYKWLVFDGASWSAVTGWQSSNQYSTLLPLGTYTVRAWARSAGNTVDAAEAFGSAALTVLATPAVTTPTITPSMASPQAVGTAVAYTAASTGGYGTLQYRWAISTNAGPFVVASGWSTNATWQWTAPAAGAYTIRALARSANNGTDVAEASADLPWTATSTTVTGLTLTPNRTSPQTPGTAIVWTATPSGGIGPHQFKWMVWDGSGWMMQPWTTANTFSWTPMMTGNYMVGVWAKSANNPADAAEYPYATAFTVAGSATPVASLTAVTPNLSSPQLAGTTVTWTATASGGTAPYEFKWFVHDGLAWTTASGWSASPSFSWTPSIANPNYQVRAWVRSAGNSVDAPESSLQSMFGIVSSSPTVIGVTLTPSAASPQSANTTVTWTATPVGGVGPHQYKWMVFNGVTWTMLPWTTSNTFAWTPTAAGTYYVGVWVKSAGNPNDAAEAPYSVRFIVQ